MARWTSNRSDEAHLVEISKQMPIGGIVLINLHDGMSIEGVVRRINVGNNGGQGGWHYYGGCEIEGADSRSTVVDYLDIDSVIDVWSTRSAEYERLGLITIVK